MRGDERGSVLPLMVVAVLLMGAIVVLIGRLGAAATDRAGARAAADAAALAGAADGEDSARALAAANGAEVIRFEVKGADALVEVRRGGARAVGRARRSAGEVGGRADGDGGAGAATGSVAGHGGLGRGAGSGGGTGAGGGDGAGTGAGAGLGDDRLAPAMRAALGRAGQLLGDEVPVTAVHPPGLAVDVPPAIVDYLAGVAPSAGLCRPSADTRPTLFEVCQTGGGDP